MNAHTTALRAGLLLTALAGGYCRAWHDRVAETRQPPAMPCAKAQQLVREHDGRLLYMPGPDLK